MPALIPQWNENRKQQQKNKPKILRKLNNTRLNNVQVKEEIAREIVKYFELNETENTTSQNMMYRESTSQKEIYIIECINLKKI